jgi:hypothetical protein
MRITGSYIDIGYLPVMYRLYTSYLPVILIAEQHKTAKICYCLLSELQVDTNNVSLSFLCIHLQSIINLHNLL